MNNLLAFVEQNQEETFSYSLAGYSAQAAARVLLQNWETAVADGCNHNLVKDIEDVIEELKQFRMAAWEALPLKNGGLGGHTADFWIDKLIEIDVSIYEAEDLPGIWGFTECDCDDYTSETEALIAAVIANSDALGIKVDE